MAEKQAEGKDGSASSGKKLNGMAILATVGLVVNLVALGGGVYFTYAATLGWNAPMITEEELAQNRKMASINVDGGDAPLIYTMDKFTVNLNGEPKRSIRLEVNLSMLNRDGYEEMIDLGKKSRIRDRVVALLQDKNFQDIESIQGKLFLKDQISLETNRILKNGVVKDVFFSDFVVQ